MYTGDEKETEVEILKSLNAHVDKKQEMLEVIDDLDDVCEGDYTIIGDNLDLHVKTIGTTKSKRNKLYHWFHMIGILNDTLIIYSILFSYSYIDNCLNIFVYVYVHSLQR